MVRVLSVTAFVLAFVAGNAQTKKWGLTELIDHAWKNHPQILSNESLAQTYSLRSEQLRANRLPSLFFNGSQNMNAGRSIDPFTYQFTNETIWSNQFSLNASVNLFNGFQNNRNLTANDYQLQSQQQLVEKLKYDIGLSIANQYLQVLLVKEQIILLDSQIAQTQRSLDRELKLKAIGRSTDLKIKQVKVQLADENAQRTAAIGNEKSALIQLKNLAMLPDEAIDVVVPETTPAPVPAGETAATVYATAEKNQPAIKYQALNEQTKQANIHAAQSALMPSLTLSGSLSTGYSSARKLTSVSYLPVITPIGYLASDPTEIVTGVVTTPTYQQNNYAFFDQVNDNFSQFVGVTLRVPIFAQKSVRTNIEVAKVQLDVAEQETKQASATLKRDIELALVQYETALQNEKNTAEVVDLQNEIYNDMQTLYKEGTTTLFELLTQKTRVYAAQSSNIRNRYERVFRQLVLDFYKGNPIKL